MPTTGLLPENGGFRDPPGRKVAYGSLWRHFATSPEPMSATAVIRQVAPVGHAGVSDDKLNNWPAVSLSGRHDFFNPCPGTTLKHKVLQVKSGACTICGGEQAKGRLLNALICQGGQVKFLINHAL